MFYIPTAKIVHAGRNSILYITFANLHIYNFKVKNYTVKKLKQTHRFILNTLHVCTVSLVMMKCEISLVIVDVLQVHYGRTHINDVMISKYSTTTSILIRKYGIRLYLP